MAAGTRPAGAVGRADAAGTAGPILPPQPSGQPPPPPTAVLAAGTAARAVLAAGTASPGRPPSSGSGRKRGLIAAGTAAGLVVIFLIVAAVAGIAPFSKSKTPVAAPTPRRPIPGRPRFRVCDADSRALAAGVAAPQLSCCRTISPTPPHNASPVKKPFDWTMPRPGRRPLSCTDPACRAATYTPIRWTAAPTTRRPGTNFNTWSGFNDSTAGSNCPPSRQQQRKGSPPGTNNNVPVPARSTARCSSAGLGSTNEPRRPTSGRCRPQDAFFFAVGADGLIVPSAHYVVGEQLRRRPTSPSPDPRRHDHARFWLAVRRPGRHGPGDGGRPGNDPGRAVLADAGRRHLPASAALHHPGGLLGRDEGREDPGAELRDRRHDAAPGGLGA